MKVYEAFRDPILHAIERNDKVLLDRIELEIVRDLGLKPDDAATGHLPEEATNWKAIGIKNVGRDLIVLWSSHTTCECGECDGTGMIRARGNSRSFDVECPECFGSGDGDSGTEYRCWTDIDGCKLPVAPVGPLEVDMPVDSRYDPLNVYYEVQRNKTKEPA